MKNLVKILFTTLSITIIATSCSVEKRVHMSGYHVKWHKQHEKRNFNDVVNSENIAEKNKTIKDLKSSKETAIAKPNATADTTSLLLNKKDLTASNEKSNNTAMAKIKKPFTEEYEASKKENKIFELQNTEEEQSVSRRKSGNLALLSFILGIIALCLPVLTLGLLAPIGFILGIIAIVTGIIALIRGSGKLWMSIVGLILGLIATGFIL